MSDYLSNLAARSLNLTEVIKPRLPALFEPHQGASGTVAELARGIENEAAPAAQHNASLDTILPCGFESTQPVVHPALGRSAEVPSADANPPIPIALSHKSPTPAALGRRVKEHRGLQKPAVIEGSEIAVSTSQVDRSASPVLSSPSSQVSSLDVPQPAPPSVVAAREADRASDCGGVQAPQVERASEPNKNRPAGVGDNTRIPPSQAAWSDGSAFELANAVIEQRALPEKAMAPAIASAESPPTRTAHTVIAQPSVAPYVKRAVPMSAEPLEAPQLAPTVHVTIGRIEVRATSPVAAPEKQRSTPPVMSLDEYLNQRARGGGDR